MRSCVVVSFVFNVGWRFVSPCINRRLYRCTPMCDSEARLIRTTDKPHLLDEIDIVELMRESGVLPFVSFGLMPMNHQAKVNQVRVN